MPAQFNDNLRLLGIGGAIGTALFVQLGTALPFGGPGSLLIACCLWSIVVMALSESLCEMVTWIPVTSPFVQFADNFVDPALGICTGMNFFFLLAFSVPFEITAFNLLLHFWTDKIPPAAVITFILVAYLLLNLCSVKMEFWLAIGKVILVVALLLFTVIMMTGANPMHDRFGFRNWNFPGTPFVAYSQPGSLGRFLGFLRCLLIASFTITGPEYIAMTAGEAANPRRALPKAFAATIYRLIAFFIGSGLAIGILLSHDDTKLLQVLTGERTGGAASPYIIAMENMGVEGLPHIVNALIMLSIFSAGNSYVYGASRTMYGLALSGHIPKGLARCTRSGIPIYCIGVTMFIACLAFLGVSNGTAVVLAWLVDILTAGILMNYAFILYTYTRFYRALGEHKISRAELPYHARFQPYLSYFALMLCLFLITIVGLPVFLPGKWNPTTFAFSYTLVFFMPCLFLSYKLIRRTKVC
ncbi:hypothetical protein BDZ89DRAFT_1090523 [Hymenopellis radicata]|nr:hypothetical protein BDZ89DRAFT_1090523 [Hymenopellis radicata]